MRFLLVVLFAACSAACGNNGTGPILTSYSNYSSVGVSRGVVMGGAFQNVSSSHPLATKDSASTSVSTIAGIAGSAGATNGAGSSSAGIKASFNIVNGITTDGNNLYLTDFGNHTIRKYSFSNHSTTTIAGVGAAYSNSVFESDNVTLARVPAASAGFNYPSGITADGKGNLYVADYANSTIRKIALPFSNSSTIVTTIAGSPGTVGSVDDTVGTTARFNHPTDITTDGKYLYVTDTNNLTIRRISLNATYSVSTIAGVPGSGGSNPFDVPVLGKNARFQYPARITTDGTNLYVTDFIKNTVSMIYSTVDNGVVQTFVKTIAGTSGVTGSVDGDGAAASFSNINGITSDGTNLYVTDSNNQTVRRLVLLSNGTWRVTTIAGAAGVGGSADGAGSVARFKIPIGITTDGTSLYVTDSNNYTIRKIQ